MIATPAEISQLKSLVDLLGYRANCQPNQLAYRFLQESSTDSNSLTYQDLDKQAQTIAAYLQHLDIRVGSRILLLYRPGLEFLGAFFGSLYAGMVAVPIQAPLHLNQLFHLEALAEDAKAFALLTTQDLLTQLNGIFLKSAQTSSLMGLISIATDALLPNQYTWQPPLISKKTIAFLQYTSGSTGAPKGVMVSHHNILHNSAIIYQAFGHSPKTQGVIWLPPFHDMGLIGGIIQPLYGGFPVTLMSAEKVMMRPLRWLDAITLYQATTSGGPNFAYDWCVQRIKPEQMLQLDLSSWEVAFTGAEPVRATTLERFANKFAACGFRREAFYPCYGMAENTLFITGGSKIQSPVLKRLDTQALGKNQVLHPHESQQQQTLVGCGFTWLGQKVSVVDPVTKTQCKDGQVGEIWIAGESVAQGYWGQDLETQRTFQAYLSVTGEGPFLRTGDLGFWLNGELFITGRLKDLIIIRGRNCYPQDIELTVQNSHIALQSEGCAAFSVDSGTEEQLVVLAEVQRRFVEGLDSKAVMQAIRQAIAEEHNLPVSEVVLLRSGSLHKTTSGKIQRHACRESFLAGKFFRLEMK